MLDWESFPLDTCRLVHPPVVYTWILVHMDWDHKDSSWEQVDHMMVEEEEEEECLLHMC